MNQIGSQMAQLGTDPNNPVGAATVDAIKDDDPTASAGDMAVGMAEKPVSKEDLPTWFDETNPVGESIIQKAGLSEEDLGAGEAGALDFEALKEQLLAATGLDLDEMKTAEETAKELQEIKDRASEPVVYKTPTTMVLQSQPTTFQVSEEPFNVAFVIRMLDQDGLEMSTVGYAAEPATVTIALADGEAGSVNGTLTVPFVTGDGRATFSDVFVENTDEMVSFTFSVDFPNFNISVIPSPVTSDEIEILPPLELPDGECEVVEGEGFDRKEVWDAECSRFCTLPCKDLGGLLDSSPQCSIRQTTECGEFATCAANNGGCQCDLKAMPKPHLINVEDHVSHSCDNGGMVSLVLMDIKLRL